MTVWLARLAWIADVAIAALPVAGRWLDPVPPPLKPTGDVAGAVWLVLDIVSRAAARAWMLPAVVGLSSAVVLCSVAGFAVLVRGGVPWSGRWSALWPLFALPLSLVLSALLDDLLPEFKR